MTQINQYSTEINALNPLADEDLFDIDKLVDADLGIYESQKMTWGYLQTIVSGGGNLGTSDLTQTDQQRTFEGGNKNLLWNLLRRFNIELSEWGDDTFAGINVNQQGPWGPNRKFIDIRKDGKRVFRVFESGRVEVFPEFNGAIPDRGGFAVGDGSLPLSLNPDNQSNAGFLAMFMSTENPTVFTNILIPETPTTFEPQNSALTWFRSNSKGVLFPSLSTIQRDAILTPEQGLVIYNTDTQKLQVYTGIGLTGWSNLN
jgi:hypothetical protein